MQKLHDSYLSSIQSMKQACQCPRVCCVLCDNYKVQLRRRQCVVDTLAMNDLICRLLIWLLIFLFLLRAQDLMTKVSDVRILKRGLFIKTCTVIEASNFWHWLWMTAIYKLHLYTRKAWKKGRFVQGHDTHGSSRTPRQPGQENNLYIFPDCFSCGVLDF